MSRLTEALRARFGEDILQRMAIAAVLAALLMGAVGVADPFYDPPEAASVETDAPPEAVALDALNATATTDYRMDWITPCGDADVQRRAGGCLTRRYLVENTDREYTTEGGDASLASGPNVYADEVSTTFYDFPEEPNRTETRALILWGDADRLDRSDLAATLTSDTVETTTTKRNDTIQLHTENETVASQLVGRSANASNSSDAFDGNVTVVVDADSGWLRSITIRYATENGSDWQRYEYDQWGEVNVERPEGTSRPPLGWVYDALNVEYQP